MLEELHVQVSQIITKEGAFCSSAGFFQLGVVVAFHDGVLGFSSTGASSAFFFQDVVVELLLPVSEIFPKDGSFFSSVGFFQLLAFHDGVLGFSSTLTLTLVVTVVGVEEVLLEAAVVDTEEYDDP